MPYPPRMLQNRLHRAFGTWPGARDGLACAGIFALFAALALPIGLWSGLLEIHASPRSAGQLAAFLAITFFVPSLFEETLFRVLLLPHTTEALAPRTRVLREVLALGAFVAMHPLNAWLVRHAARPVFYAPSFLVLCALLGAACTLAYRRTGSVWPCVAMHWLAVAAWKLFLGGPEAVFGA